MFCSESFGIITAILQYTDIPKELKYYILTCKKYLE